MAQKIGIIIQARTTSSRFPNKVLAHFAGVPIIDNILNELFTLPYPKIVAMPNYASNQCLIDHLDTTTKCYVYTSDLENDVLGRMLNAAKAFEIDIIIRICSDCPLIKAADITFMLEKFMAEGGKRMVWGLGTWIFTRKMLEDVEKNSNHADDREHCGFHYMSKSVDYYDDLKRLEAELIE